MHDSARVLHCSAIKISIDAYSVLYTDLFTHLSDQFGEKALSAAAFFFQVTNPVDSAMDIQSACFGTECVNVHFFPFDQNPAKTRQRHNLRLGEAFHFLDAVQMCALSLVDDDILICTVFLQHSHLTLLDFVF